MPEKPWIWLNFNPDSEDDEDIMRMVTMPSVPRMGESMVVKDPKTGHSEWLVEDVRWVFKNDGKDDFGAAIIILERYPRGPHAP